jgi:hypothetical protein
MNLSSANKYPMRHFVHSQDAHFQEIGFHSLLLIVAFEESVTGLEPGFNAQDQLSHIERLDHVVIRARLKPGDTVCLLHPSGQNHDDRSSSILDSRVTAAFASERAW